MLDSWRAILYNHNARVCSLITYELIWCPNKGFSGKAVEVRHSPATVSGYESFELTTVSLEARWEGEAGRPEATKSGDLPDPYRSHSLARVRKRLEGSAAPL